MIADKLPGTAQMPTEPHSKAPACAECKRLKVKCVRIELNNPHSPCIRCHKKQIECMVGTKFKRSAGSTDRVTKNRGEDSRKRRSPATQHFDREQFNSMSMRDQLLTSWKMLTSRDDLRLHLLEKHESASLARPSNNVLRRGLMSREQIVHRLKLYRTCIYPKYPTVQCPVEDDFEEMMEESPILFHTIIDIGSIMVTDETELEQSIVLHNLVLRTIVDEIMIVSVKNMELLKCLVLLTHWYNESELYHQQRLHVLTALAVSVSYDLGMGGASIQNSSTAPAFEQLVAPQAATDFHGPESYRIWLSVYSTLFQSLMAIRRPVNSIWNKYTEEAIRSLSAAAVDTQNEDAQDDNIDQNKSGQDGKDSQSKKGQDDQGGNNAGGGSELNLLTVCEMAQIRRLQERIAISVFKKNNEPVAPDYSDPVTEYAIQQFDTEINTLRNNSNGKNSRREMALLLCGIFLHQAVLYKSFDESIGRAPFTNFSLNICSGPLTYQAERSFTVCVQSARSVLDYVNSRPLHSVAAETSNFWSSMTLCCDILLKCRACCIFNRYYAAACFVSDKDLTRVLGFTSLCDRVIKIYPNCNNAVSFGFFVKLILCHHDARVHYHSARLPVESFGDPMFIMQMANMAQSQNVPQPINVEGPINAPKQPVSAQQQRPVNTGGFIDAEKQLSNTSFDSPLENERRVGMTNEYDTDMMANGSMNDAIANASVANVSMANGSMANGSMANGSVTSGSMDDSLGGADVDGSASLGTNQYVSSPFSPFELMNQDQLQQADPAPPFDFESLDFDVAALNDIDSFWNNFVGGKGSSGPFGVEFPL